MCSSSGSEIQTKKLKSLHRSTCQLAGCPLGDWQASFRVRRTRVQRSHSSCWCSTQSGQPGRHSSEREQLLTWHTHRQTHGRTDRQMGTSILYWLANIRQTGKPLGGEHVPVVVACSSVSLLVISCRFSLKAFATFCERARQHTSRSQPVRYSPICSDRTDGRGRPRDGLTFS